MKSRFDWPSKKVLFTGCSGTGKTTLLEKVVKAEKASRKFVFDHKNGEFARKNGFPVLYRMGDMIEATARGGWIVYDPIREFPGKYQRAFEIWCEFIMAVVGEIAGRKLLIVDELQKLQTTTKPPEKLLEVCDMGRTMQLDCFFITPALNRLHNAVRGQLTETFVFRVVEKNAIQWLTDNGLDGDAIRRLRKGEYFWSNLDSGEIKKGGSAF